MDGQGQCILVLWRLTHMGRIYDGISDAHGARLCRSRTADLHFSDGAKGNVMISIIQTSALCNA